MKRTVIAHVREKESSGRYEIQPLMKHLEGVATLASQFAQKISPSHDLGRVGYIIGYLHDIGKFQHGFQNYITKESGLDSSIPYAYKTPHSYPGAHFSLHSTPYKNPLFKKIVALCIAAHHRGLYDDSSFRGLAEDATMRDLCEHLLQEIPEEELLQIQSTLQGIDERSLYRSISDLKCEDPSLLIRMLFSCLVDADFLDTERFMNKEKWQQRTQSYPSFSELQQKLESFLSSFPKDTPIKCARSAFQSQCKAHAKQASEGAYSLYLPTGGGKTLASMAWAMEYAIRNNCDRIIYVIPYTSIITQTASTFKKVFGKENVLEHHSDIQIEEGEDLNKTKLLAENWDAPIVVTTNVQFFESLFSNRVSRCRKLHNICNSVVVFDEVQMFPTALHTPMLRMIEGLIHSFKVQVLFCSATIPLFDEELGNPNRNKQNYFALPRKITPIIDEEENRELFKLFEKVDYHLDPIKESSTEMACRLQQHRSFLCIVNARNDASLLYNAVHTNYKGDDLFLLSRRMCTLHIQQKLKVIEQRLREGKPVKLVATQLVEAGVDLDFPIVYRAAAGLDSIVQAGGRCNREGLMEKKGKVFLFELTDGSKRGRGLSLAYNVAQDLLATKVKQTDPQKIEQELIAKYYRSFFYQSGNFDKKEITPLLWDEERIDELRFDFESTAENFRYIEEKNQIPLLVPYGAIGKNLIEKVTKKKPLTQDEFRLIGQLQIGLYSNDLKDLPIQTVEYGKLSLLVLTDSTRYRDDIGIEIQNHWVSEPLTK